MPSQCLSERASKLARLPCSRFAAATTDFSGAALFDPVASLGLPVPAFRPISGDLAVVVDKPGGDREAQAKGIRYAHGIHETHYQESVLIRSAAEAKIREADRLECEAWNAIMWAGDAVA